jgi:hypothetical protein
MIHVVTFLFPVFLQHYVDSQCIFSYLLLQCCHVLVRLVGFEGANCEVNVDDCAQANCPDNRVCVDGVNDYECRCRQGFTGDNCTTSINFCDENPCQNNATCLNTYGNYMCTCPIGISGESSLCTLSEGLSINFSLSRSFGNRANIQHC